jgi:HAD superfamily hydrolase (TIGR01549 family)
MAHLFFDLDRTLWHHERNHYRFFEVLHGAFNWSEWGSSDDWARNYLEINDRLWDHIQLHNLGVEYVRARRFPLLFRHMGLQVGRGKDFKVLGSECEQLLKQQLPDMGEGYDGVHDAFAALREAGHRLHIVTNGVQEPQRRKIAALGLSEFIEELVTSDVARSYKPDPEIFHYALRSTGAQAVESWMIGDSLLRDVLGGQAVGMRTAWFRAEDALAPDAEATAELEFCDWRVLPAQLEAAIRG